MDDTTKTVVALASRLGDTTRPSLPPTKWHRLSVALNDGGIELAELLQPGFDPGSIGGLDDQMRTDIVELLSSAPAATVAAADLERRGIHVVTIDDERYPAAYRPKLGDLAPPILYAVGNLGLLQEPGIGIVGSRNVIPEGKEFAEEVARRAVAEGLPVVSGGARGVDQFAMNAAFMAGGSVVGVLADSLQKKLQTSEMLGAIDAGSVCLVSQQIPSAGFTPASAMARNKLVYALTTTTVVVASDHERGGTWAGATEALKKQLSDVAVWMGGGGGPGNGPLADLGARAVGSVSAVFDESVDLTKKVSSEPEQLRLA